ncbi:MAG: methyltransferase [Bacteroidales bacterium]|nr:methyltransferase [Bacteroidales bacterium]
MKYDRIKKIPLRKYHGRKYIINEIINAARYFLGHNQIFNISLFPRLWESIAGKKISILHRMFFLNSSFEADEWINIIGKQLFVNCVSNNFFQRNNNKFFSLYRFVPWEEKIYITSIFDPTSPHFAYISYDSFYFVKFLRKAISGMQLRTGLDIGCGVGILSIALCEYCEDVEGIDINKYALSYAERKANKNYKSIKFSNMDYNRLKGISNKRYSIIVANPPYVNSKAIESHGLSYSLSSDGGTTGIEKTMEIINLLNNVLDQDGIAFILSRSPVIEGNDILLNELKKGQYKFSINYRIVSDGIDHCLTVNNSFRQVIIEVQQGNNLSIKHHSWFDKNTHFF